MQEPPAVELILASASPRRATILGMLGLAPRVVAPIDAERPHDGLQDPAAYATDQALAKLRPAAEEAPGAVVVAADTVVVLDGRVLGKPGDAGAARAMLGELSGRTHEVITGVAVGLEGRERAGFDRTRVNFRPLSAGAIHGYVATGAPLDKAGAYGIQDRGAALVRSVEGCFYNVMGLPVGRLLELLAELGVGYDPGSGMLTQRGTGGDGESRAAQAPGRGSSAST
ncbi:MAG: nucleoside triphosphate pyrophosphatase [Gemmatimonadota bacterium]